MRLHDMLEYRARLQPSAPFARMGDQQLTYAEGDRCANQIAHALLGAGLGRGDRFGVLAKNSIESILLYYGASKAGVVPVPLNYRLAPPEWQYILEDAGAKLVVARGEYAAALAPVRSKLGAVQSWIGLATDAEGWTRWDDFLGSQPTTAPDVAVESDWDLYQMYTSGTTGRPKGAVLSQRAVCSNLHQGALAIGGKPGERWLIVAPIYHAAAALTSFMGVQAGGTLVVHEDFAPAAAVGALAEDDIAVSLLVPAMIQACLMLVPGVEDRSYDRLRMIIYGASPIAEKTLADAMRVFDCDFIQGYGMTETTAAATYLFPEDHRRALDGEAKLLLSAGRALVGTEVRIVDRDDRPLPVGSVGEVAIRGPQLMSGYWNRPEDSAKALRGGWMHTGDAGMLDDEGFLYIQDRVKDMIVSGGENIYPREVEEVLFQHPAIADAAVIGVPHEKWGESVLGIVVLREGQTATPEEIIAYCKGKLGGYKCPRAIEFIDVLPRNPSGKVLKRELREPYWQGQGRRVAGS